MARWALTCKNCRAVFGYSRIPTPDTLAEYFIPSRPEFPPSGVELECPGCKTKSTYQRFELIYKSR